jgi:hypothetical protein
LAICAEFQLDTDPAPPPSGDRGGDDAATCVDEPPAADD